MRQAITVIFSLFLYSTVYATAVAPKASFNFANETAAKSFIEQMVKKYKFKKSDLITLFSSVKPRPTIIRSIRFPLEKSPWYAYKKIFITEPCITEGLLFWDKHQDILDQAERMYGVPASIIVATLGIETRYGKNTGEYPVIDALVNLAFNNTSRATYFLQELEAFLLLTREQHLNPLKVMGSYAGAIGEPQFMPSSYRQYAVSFSGNSSIDLSHNQADVISSIANYYQKHGWQTKKPVAIPLSVSGGRFQFSLKKPKNISLSELIQTGMITHTALSQPTTTLIPLQTKQGYEYWLGFTNFDVIKRYNNSNLYAMAVYQLSYYLTAARYINNNT